MKRSLELPWPLLPLMCPDITGVASLSRKDLALVKPKGRILKNVGAVSETLACCGYKAERMCLWEGRLTFLPGFQNTGQEVMLCTVRGPVGGRVKKGELQSFERWSSEGECWGLYLEPSELCGCPKWPVYLGEILACVSGYCILPGRHADFVGRYWVGLNFLVG